MHKSIFNPRNWRFRGCSETPKRGLVALKTKANSKNSCVPQENVFLGTSFLAPKSGDHRQIEPRSAPVINGTVSVKQIARGCMVCKQRKARPNEPFMSTLPSFRVEQGNPPFFKSGVDFFGPIYVKQKRSRVKRWGCIFVCISVRAVHIKLAESLDTDSFTNAMQRFIN